MSLRERQSEFAEKVGLLLLFIYAKGYQVTFGDAWARTGHRKRSFHYRRLAIDLNLFKDGIWLKDTEDHRFAGEFWESLDRFCTWGGHWKDGNHYSYGERR